MKLCDINLDCLGSLISEVPLEKRLFTLRQVNSQWKTAVEDICKTQTELTLQIGSRNQWEWMVKRVKSRNLLVNAVSPFHRLTAARLTDELTTFLISTFPRLQSLAIVVDKRYTADGNFLRNLPRLISAFSNSLTTLQLVWNVEDATFQAIFSPLISSIDGLHQLKRLSFFDAGYCLKVPPFDLPHLLSTSLETLDFYSTGSSPELARHWEDSLLARQNNKARSELVKIHFVPNLTEELPILHSFPANVAVHFHSMNLNVCPFWTVADLEHLGSGAFINLQKLWLSIRRDSLSMSDVLVQLARLPHLTDLTLRENDLRPIDYPANRPFPVLSAVRRLHITLPFPTPLNHQVNPEALQPWQVFPNLLTISLTVNNYGCQVCGWLLAGMSKDGRKIQMVEGSDRLIEQCVTRLATPFVNDKCKPRVTVWFKGTPLRDIGCTVDFDDEGRVKLLTKLTRAI